LAALLSVTQLDLHLATRLETQLAVQSARSLEIWLEPSSAICLEHLLAYRWAKLSDLESAMSLVTLSVLPLARRSATLSVPP
jgi:hypothetical protein